MTRAVKAGATYFAVVYTVGFVLGTVRVLLLAPLIGEVAAVLLEMPIMLVASWVACRWCIKGFAVPAAAQLRLVMGGIALGLLIAGEFGVSIFIFDRSWGATVAAMASPLGLIGLSAQVVFALFPLVQAVLGRRWK